MDRTALPPGTSFGELEIVRVLAQGGFGIVYLARDHSLDRDVAVKEFMPAHLVTRSGGMQVSVGPDTDAKTFAIGLQSFIDEAKLLAQLAHPAIVKVYRYWEAHGTGYMVMPYLRGPTLGDVRRSMEQPPTESWLRSVVNPLLDALATLHAQGICHRDIAPDNVVLSESGVPVLLDFGAARRLVSDHTQVVTAVLKPRYAPIEQYAEAKHLRQGPWTDLYALAAVVSYLIEGTPPPASTTRCVYDEREPLADQQILGISQGFLSAMDWALAVRPQDRPQSVEELREAMNGWSRRQAAKRARRDPTRGAKRVGHGHGHGHGRDHERHHDVAQRTNHAERAPFARTIRQGTALRVVTRASSQALERVMALPATRIAARPQWLAAAAVVFATTMALSFWLLPANDSAATAAAVATSDVTSAPPTVRLSPVDEAPSAAELPALVELASADAVLPQAVQTTVASVMPRRSAETKVAKRRTGKEAGRQSARGAKPAAAQASLVRQASLGPTEICAGRNFFTRPYCVQRQCEEPRFKAHAECVQLRGIARNEHP